MAGKIVLVTGGTSGIGRATATGLASMGAHVAITGRDLGRVEAAAVEIRGATGNPRVDAFGADMSSQAEVRRLAAEVLDSYTRLDVLINNVGGFWATRHVTADGLEQTFAVNHLAAFLLTDLLLDRLKASGPSRVVTVSSGAQSMGTIDFEDLQGERVYDLVTISACRSAGERAYSGQTAYNQSKLASVMFTYELARRLDGTGVTATVLHPGVVNTAFGAEDPSRIFKVIVPFVRPFMKTPEQGAATSIYLASSPAVEGITGRYFANRRPTTSNVRSYDEEAASRLWRVSSGLVHAELSR